MIAPAIIPEKYGQWNARHGAPLGRRVRLLRVKRWFMSDAQIRCACGVFAMQMNSSTRTFEYPWAFDVGQLRPGMKVLEIGGSLAGFQFVLDQFGCEVVNVDPGLEARGVGWPCDKKTMTRLNVFFHTQVDLRNTTVERAKLADGEFDRAYSISVIEHLPAEDLANVMSHVFRSLKPGGLFILTVDLFLNIQPFCSHRINKYGTNQNICELIRSQPWKLVSGRPDELFGFPEFDTDKILGRLDTFLLGQYFPALAQCIVLQKPAA